MTTPRTNTPVSGGPSGLEALLQQAQGAASRTGAATDAAAFQRWMQQYRQPETGISGPPQTPTAVPASRLAPTPSAARGQGARDGQIREAALSASGAPDADSTRETDATAQANVPAQRPASKELRKPAATARAQEPNKGAKTDAPARADSDGVAEGTEAAGDAGDAVRFQTAQGEATAWVKELPVPDEISASDPAAMLAWLASLQSPAQQSAQTVVDTEAGARASGLQFTSAEPAGWPSRGHTGAEALTLQALQRGLADGGMGQGQARGESGDTEGEGGGLALSALNMGETSAASGDASAASFASALQREVQPWGGARAEGTVRHYTGNLHTPMESPAFTQALSERVAFWVNGPAAEGPMTAELRLNPAEMGPVHIRIELDGQNAHIDFAAAAAETREAIEASLGQLSASLEESGLKLTGGGVSDQAPQQQAWAQAASGQQGSGQGAAGRQGREPDGRWVSTTVTEGVSESLGARPPREGRPGGLDLYA